MFSKRIIELAKTRWVGLPIVIILAISVLFIGVVMITESIKNKSKPVSKSTLYDRKPAYRLPELIKIPVDRVEIVDVNFDGKCPYSESLQESWCPTISGWVRNRSDKPLNRFTIRVQITDSLGQRQTSSTTIPNVDRMKTQNPLLHLGDRRMHVPSGETRRFSGEIPNLDRPDRKGWEISYELTAAWTWQK